MSPASAPGPRPKLPSEPEPATQPQEAAIRPGLVVLADTAGAGPAIHRRDRLRLRLRLWLAGRDPVRWLAASGFVGESSLEDDGATLVTSVQFDRRSLIAGLFHGLEGMRVGGTRRLSIAPNLAYRERGVPGIVPPNARLIAEVTVLDAAPFAKG